MDDEVLEAQEATAEQPPRARGLARVRGGHIQAAGEMEGSRRSLRAAARSYARPTGDDDEEDEEEESPPTGYALTRFWRGSFALVTSYPRQQACGLQVLASVASTCVGW